MRTAKCIVALGVVAVAGLVAAAAQTGPGAPPAQKEPSNTRAADCLVRITADPGIIPLNPETVTNLLYSSAVLGKAAKEMLGSDAPQDPRGLISIQWLAETGRGDVIGTADFSNGGQDREVLRQLEEIYGRQYAEMMGVAPRDGQEVPKERNGREDARPGASISGSPYGGDRTNPYGGGGAYGGAPVRAEMGQIGQQEATIRLSIRIPDGARPVAREFLGALVENLQESLNDAHQQYIRNLDRLLLLAVSQREDAEKRLAQVAGTSSPDEAAIREQLDQIIDFSAVTAQMPFKEAIEILKNSVVPVLPIVVQWNALRDASIEAPAGIDGLPAMRVGTALDLLVRSFDKLGYRIQGGVIFVAPAHSLRLSGASAAKSKDQTDVRIMAARKNELARTVQSLELDLAGMQARRDAIQRQMAMAEGEANDRLANDAVTQELEKLVQLSTTQFERLKQLADTGRLSQTELAQGQESVARARVELARRREELAKSISGSRLEQFNTELSRMTIDEAEKQTQLGILSEQLDEVQQQLVQASTFDPEAVRTRIAQETLETINRRIGELETRLATLQPPTVVMLGAN